MSAAVFKNFVFNSKSHRLNNRNFYSDLLASVQFACHLQTTCLSQVVQVADLEQTVCRRAIAAREATSVTPRQESAYALPVMVEIIVSKVRAGNAKCEPFMP